MFTKKKNILAEYDPTELQLIRELPFLVIPCAILCYNIIPVKTSVCAKDDNF